MERHFSPLSNDMRYKSSALGFKTPWALKRAVCDQSEKQLISNMLLRTVRGMVEIEFALTSWIENVAFDTVDNVENKNCVVIHVINTPVIR